MPTKGLPPATRNASILGYFKPLQRDCPPARQDGSRQDSSSPHARHVSGNPPPPCHTVPSSPDVSLSSTPAPRASLGRDAVIAGSDDDADGDSDDSLEDLASLLQTHRETTVSSHQASDLYGEPKTKRVATLDDFSSSSPKSMLKHEFDMKALVSDAQIGDGLLEQFKRSLENDIRLEQAARGETRPAQEAFEAIIGDDAVDVQRAMKALERTRNMPTGKQWRFFEEGIAAKKATVGTAFPKDAAEGPWVVLCNKATREQHLQSGILHMLLLKGLQKLPDELFLWLLDGICSESRAPLRSEYINLLVLCPEQISRLLTPTIVDRLLEKLGATAEARQHSACQPSTDKDEGRYQGHSWSRLVSFMDFVAGASPHMPPGVLAHVFKTLLKMAVDPFMIEDLDVLMAYRDATKRVCNCVATKQWTDFCSEMCLFLCNSFDLASLRVAPLLLLPASPPRLNELRRWLAMSYFLGDATLARNDPDDSLSLPALTRRLGADEFRTTKATDYVELRSHILLLNIAVGDGFFTSFEDPNEEEAFNALVDELTGKLRWIWRNINDTNASQNLRTEAKNTIEWVQERINYTVRTRLQPKESVFNILYREDDATLPQQRLFMREFLNPETDQKG